MEQKFSFSYFRENSLRKATKITKMFLKIKRKCEKNLFSNKQDSTIIFHSLEEEFCLFHLFLLLQFSTSHVRTILESQDRAASRTAEAGYVGQVVRDETDRTGR
jgi:hypothetical protein